MTTEQIPVNSVESQLKGVTRKTLIYGFGNIGVKAVSFLLIPLYTRYLSTYQVGIVVLLELLEVLFSYVAPLGIFAAVWRYFHLEQKQGNVKNFTASSFFFVMAANGFFLILSIFFSSTIAKYYLSDTEYTGLISVFFIVLFFGLTRIFILMLLQIYARALQFICLVSIEFLLLTGLTAWFIIKLDLGLWGIVYAKLVTTSLFFVLTSAYVILKYGFHFKYQLIVRSLRYGFPLIFQGIGLLILAMSSRYFIKELISTDMAGIYGISYKFGMMINMVLVTPFVQAWQPLLYRLENDPDQKLIYQKVALYYTSIATFAWLGLCVLSKYLILFTTTANYYQGIIVVPFVAFSYLLYGLQNIFQAGALLHNKTAKMMFYTVLTALLNMVLNILMIRQWGMLGAAVATVVCYLLMLVLIFRLSQQEFYVNWRWRKMLAIIGIGIFLSIFYLINTDAEVLNTAKDVVIILVFPLILVLFKLVSIREVKRLISQFSK